MRLGTISGLLWGAWAEERAFAILDLGKGVYTVFCEQFATSVWNAREHEARRVAEEKHTAINQFMRFVFHEVLNTN